MKTAKITEIGKARRWEGPHGDVFYIPLTLDNGETINLGKKKEDAFKVGDTVNYEVVEEGKKWREVKDNPTPRRSFNSEANKAAMVGMALKIAFSCYYDKNEENFTETIALAHRIVDEAMNMLGDEKSDNTDDQNLPF